MTPHSKQRVLAAYAEVDIGPKIKRITERPLTNSQSDEYLDKLLPQSTESDEYDRDKFVVSPYGTLPRQRHKGSNSKSALPEFQRPSQEAQAVLDSSKQARQMRIYAEIEEPLALSSSERDQRAKQQQATTTIIADTASMPSNSPKGDQPPPIPPQTADSLRLDSPVPPVPPQTANSLKLHSPAPSVPPQTADSLKLDSPVPPVTNEYEMPTIAAYATVEAKDVVVAPKNRVNLRSKDVVTCKPSKEEIAAKTKSLGRSLKPKSKPAPLPPHPTTSAPQPVPRNRSKKRLSRTHSAEMSSPGNSDSTKPTIKTELIEHKDPLYESVDDLDLNIKPKSPPKAVSDSPKQTEFLFKNREFISVGKRLTSSITSYSNDDSDDSTDWDSGEDDEEEEEEQEGQEVWHNSPCGIL